MNKELKKYLKSNVFPRYERYYAHGMMHVKRVIKDILFLAKYYKLDKDMAYVIAVYHDIGLNIDRENHERASGKVLRDDEELKKYFSKEQIEIMAQAVEDHRGSRRTRPRNFYGEIMSDADRDFNVQTLAKRQIPTSIKNYPELKTFEEHFERCYNYYLHNRLGGGKHFNLWTNNPILLKRRDKYEKTFFDKEKTRKIYKREYDKIIKNGIMEKLITFYIDY